MIKKRKKIEGPTSKTSFDLPVGLVDKVDLLVGKLGISRVSAVRDALDMWVQNNDGTVTVTQLKSFQKRPPPDSIPESVSDTPDPEREFLLECSRIYKSDFGKALQENVTFFGVGLAAVEAIAGMRLASERSPGDAEQLGPGERRAVALLDNAENEAHLLKAATHDVVEELRRDRADNTRTTKRTQPRRKSGSTKAGSGGGN